MRLWKLVVILVFMCAATMSSYGVVLAGTDGSANTNAPVDDPGFNYIGVFQNDRSSVYLGDSWFLTANHNGAPSTVTMGGITYSYMASSWIRLTNAAGAGIDLAMFRITESPAGGVSIRDTTPSVNAPLIMIGNGRDRTSDLIKWNSSWEVVTQGPYTYSGYTYDGTSPYDTSLRWGNNTVLATGIVANGMTYFSTDFDNVTGEGLGVPGDSGGGVFIKNGTQWELAGITLDLLTYGGQPANTAVFNDQNRIADLSVYRDQINQVIPEPTTAILLAGVGVVFGIIKRIRYMYQ